MVTGGVRGVRFQVWSFFPNKNRISKMKNKILNIYARLCTYNVYVTNKSSQPK